MYIYICSQKKSGFGAKKKLESSRSSNSSATELFTQEGEMGPSKTTLVQSFIKKNKYFSLNY